jgi:hypothetical protein
MYGDNEPHPPKASYSGGEIRLGDSPTGGLSKGTVVGYRLIVTKADDSRFGAEARAQTMEPLLLLLHQFEDLGYQFVRLESIYGG